MHTPKIDFLKPNNKNSKLLFPRTAPRARNSFLIIFLFAAALGSVIIINYSGRNEENIIEQKTFSFFSSMKSLITSGDRELKGERDNRINILVLGIGGEGHEGANLTDTIILLSVNPKTKQIGMISIPRDLLAPIPGYGYRRINNAYAFAEDALPGSGGNTAKKVVGDIFSLEINYFVTVNFNGFKQLIDDLGGVSIDIENSFTDPYYPTDDFKTKVVSFKAGRQLMDGTAALQYARSRHGGNGEGSDFARSKRQQNLIMAIRDKALSLAVFANPAKLLRIYQTFSEYISTDFESWEIIRLANILKDAPPEKIVRRTLEETPYGPLVPRMIDGAFVLLPESGSWDEIRSMAQNIFSATAPEQKKKKITVEIQNGTVVPGYAAGVAEILRREGYQVIKIGNAKLRDYEKSVIYENGDKEKLEEDMIKIRSLLGANVSTSPLLPQGMENSATGTKQQNADFLIILGTLSLAVLQQ